MKEDKSPNTYYCTDFSLVKRQIPETAHYNDCMKMERERTSVIEGETPVLLVAPHGYDDLNTDYIAEKVAKEFGAYAVINRGWKRNLDVDHWRDFANCNDVRHLHEEVVREEFLNPILRCAAKIKKKYDEKVFMLIIHGCGDEVREVAGDPDLDLIIGSGDGYPPSHSCRSKIKNAFIHHLQNESFGVYEGKPKGKYSGRSRNNLNQLFVRWYPDERVNSLQMEIVQELRCDSELLDLTIGGLISAIDGLMLFDDTTNLSPLEMKRI